MIWSGLVILAFVIFWMVRQFSAARRRFDAAPAEPPPPPEVKLLGEIRDLLKERQNRAS